MRTISRLNFFRIGILGGMTVLGWRLWDMQKPLQENFSGPDVRKPPAPETRFIKSKAPRGIVFDRAGKALVTNAATYSVMITANDLPDPSKGTTKEERQSLTQQRQEVYDNLARFLGMSYYIGIIPEQVNGVKNKKGAFTNGERNAILNELEVLTGISALDWDKRLTQMAADKTDKSLLVINEKEPVPIEQFDRYVYLRTKFEAGVLFLSEGERKMLEARFYTPEYQPVEVWSNLSREDTILLDEKRLEFPGVSIQTSYQREYADPRLYGHILGYTGRFGSTDQLDQANKEAYGDYADANDPASKIPIYDIDDKIGQTGIEASMEPFLRGVKSATEVIVSSTGHILQTVKVGKPAQPGNSIVLTIDSAFQAQVANSLEKWINEATKNSKNVKVKEGAAVVMDVNTGEVLAMVAFPFYNNNLYNKPYNKWTDAEVAEMNDEVKAVQVNRALDGRYAPGSTFKLITAAAALNEKSISPYTTFYCNGLIRIPTTQNVEPSQKFRCWGTHNILDVRGAIENSCDIFFYNAGVPDQTNTDFGRSRYYNQNSNQPNYFRGVGINLLDAYMEMFNVGKKTGIEILSEYKGVLAGPQIKKDGTWSIGDTMTTSIGQGDLEVTPLQMAMITAAFANGGKLLQPKLVRQIKDPEGKEVVGFQPKVIRDVTKDPVKWTMPDPKDDKKTVTQEFVLAPGVIQLIREGMLAVTGVAGTANRVMYNQTGRLKVAGKTGTAEYGEVLRTEGDRDIRASRAWFTAFAPYDKPEIAVTVLISGGDNVLEGSTFAVPAVKEILEYKFPDLVKQKA